MPKRPRAAKTNGANVGFEQQFWQAADALRRSLDRLEMDQVEEISFISGPTSTNDEPVELPSDGPTPVSPAEGFADEVVGSPVIVEDFPVNNDIPG